MIRRVLIKILTKWRDECIQERRKLLREMQETDSEVARSFLEGERQVLKDNIDRLKDIIDTGRVF